jgi:outer membrane lipoprotein-sorting protein
MSVLNSRPALRWVVPAAAAAAVIGGGAAIGTLSAAADPSLPPRSAAQLLVDLQTARLDGISGTVVQRADLGLPALPNIGGQGSTELTSLVSGRHTLRVWYAGPEQARVALMGTLGETDVIRNGKDVWIWSSRTNTASHRTLADRGEPEPLPSGLPSTPQEAADRALAAIDPSTEVSVGRAATVAGRNAYELVLAPRDKASLVHQVRIAIDAKEHVPLRFEVFAKGAADPALEVAFTQVDFGRPAPEQFVFNPPPGTKVTEESAKSEESAKTGEPAKPHGAPKGPMADAREPKIVGTGWTTVLVGRAPAPGQGEGDRQGAGAQQLGAVLDRLQKVSGTWGSGRLLSGKLFSVLLTDDGRVLAGLVSPDRLYQVAQEVK